MGYEVLKLIKQFQKEGVGGPPAQGDAEEEGGGAFIDYGCVHL